MQDIVESHPILIRVSMMYSTTFHSTSSIPIPQVYGLPLGRRTKMVQIIYVRYRWESPVNYPVFTVVMVIYHYFERIWRIIVTPIFV